jgi:uncharacterized alkaline shock family protein YloU
VASRRRGHTWVAPRVVETVAGRAAVEVDGVRAPSSGAAPLPIIGTASGQASPEDRRDARPGAPSRLSGTSDRLTIGIEVALRYPEPVAALSEAVRRRVVETLDEQLGLDPARVDVVVAELWRADAPSGGGRSG